MGHKYYIVENEETKMIEGIFTNIEEATEKVTNLKSITKKAYRIKVQSVGQTLPILENISDQLESECDKRELETTENLRCYLSKLIGEDIELYLTMIKGVILYDINIKYARVRVELDCEYDSPLLFVSPCSLQRVNRFTDDGSQKKMAILIGKIWEHESEVTEILNNLNSQCFEKLDDVRNQIDCCKWIIDMLEEK